MSYHPDRSDWKSGSPYNPAPPGNSGNAVGGVLLLGVVLAGVPFVLLEQFAGDHFFRFLATLLPVLLGLGLGVVLAGKKRWRVGLGFAVGGLAAAAGVWMFVPTTAGLSYWGAVQRLRDLRTEQVDTLKAYRAHQKELKELLRQFPSFQPQGEELEQKWTEQVTDATLARADKLLATDPAGASEEYRQLVAGLERERRYAGVRERLAAGRRRALQARLDAGKAECKGLLDREQFDQAREAAAKVKTSLDDEARAVGLSRELSGLAEQVEQAEQDWLKRTVDAAIAQAVVVQATDPGRASTELRKLASSLAARRSYHLVANRLLVARRNAVAAGLEAAKKECRDLLKQERFQDAAAAAELLIAGFDKEAAAVGLLKEFTQLSQAYGFLSDLARQAGKPKPE
jgi:hypothetical protein